MFFSLLIDCLEMVLNVELQNILPVQLILSAPS